MHEITHKIFITGGGAYKFNNLIQVFLNKFSLNTKEFLNVELV